MAILHPIIIPLLSGSPIILRLLSLLIVIPRVCLSCSVILLLSISHDISDTSLLFDSQWNVVLPPKQPVVSTGGTLMIDSKREKKHYFMELHERGTKTLYYYNHNKISTS